MLTDNKADINATDKAGNTAVILATMNKNDAAVDFLVKQFCELDLEKKSKEKNWTALHWAVSTESETNIRALVKAGAAMNAGHFNKGETPVKLAYRLGNREILRLMHDLEATSHRRVAYCSDGEELKYRCFILGPRLEGDQPGPPLPDLSPEMLSLYQAIQEELWKHEDIEIAYPPRETADTQSPELENSVFPSTETGPRDMGIAASSTDGGVQDSSTGVKSKTKGVSTASKRRRQVKERRRLIRRKLDPIMASWADAIRDAAENSAVKDEVYPPPLKIQIHVFTLIFLSLKTESVHVQNMSYVQVLETNSVPPEKKPHRRG